MKEPLSIPRFIALVLESPAESETIKSWFKHVKEYAPSGVLLNIPTSDDQGMPKTVCMVHREKNDSHSYLVPLSRDLSESEAEAVVDAFTDANPDLDFDIHSSATHGDPVKEVPTVTVDQDRYVALCTAWAKRQHEQWMKDREDNGWRYGTTLSLKDKTNPLIRPWDQLPEKYRKPDLDEPQALLDLLNDQGYAVVTKGEVEAMINLMRHTNPLLREGAFKKALAAIEGEKKIEEDQVDEDFFKKKTPAVSADRLAQASRTGDTRQAARDWDPAQPHRPQQGVIARSQPQAPLAPAQSGGFGKRRPTT